MAHVYYDNDANLSIMQSKRLAFIGYGNQGAAQSKNLRDSGVQQILIGNRDDSYKLHIPPHKELEEIVV
jgi:ketol-acid reductoisomerase